MKRIIGLRIAAIAVAGVTAGVVALDVNGRTEPTENSSVGLIKITRELAQGPVITSPADPAARAPGSAVDGNDTASTSATTDASENEAPEITVVSGQLLRPDSTPASGGVVYFLFQNRLNEIPHADSTAKITAMSEVAAAVDTEGSFTLKMKPGNFAMVYDPSATEVPSEPGAESMAVMKRATREQVQGRIAAIKENAAKGLPIQNGKLGEMFVVENRYIRPPISNFGEISLQSNSAVTVKAVDENGELIGFPATLRLRGKNGDIMEPHTPSVSTRAQYSFHDLMPQSYQVFALGSMPRPGAGDEVTTPTVSNDQFLFAGDPVVQEVVVELPQPE